MSSNQPPEPRHYPLSRKGDRHHGPHAGVAGDEAWPTVKRKISAILAADIAGYSKLVAEDEEETLRRLAMYRAVFDDFVARWGGRIFNTAGDAALAEFPSSVDAVRCAVDVQESIRARNLAYPQSRQMLYRIGITVADVVEREGDLLGDGVNIASRLGGLAVAGGICVSRAVYEQVASKLSVKFDDLGEQPVKNMPNPIHAYGIAPHPTAVAHPAGPQARVGRRRNVLLAGLALLSIAALGSAAVALYLRGPGQDSYATGLASVARPPAGLNGRDAGLYGRDPRPTFDDAKTRAFAAGQNIPLPPSLRVVAAGASVPGPLAGYLGAWGGDQGWNGKGRRIILVIESVDESGTAVGLLAQGPPPDAINPDQRPARYRSIAGSITDAGLAFTLAGAKYTFRGTSDGLMWGRLQPPAERDNVDFTIMLERID
jgi:class 3 adenylate cyclase